jgi:protein-disulfide isomerase
MSSKLKIDLLSGACCNPSETHLDKQYEAKIKEVLATTKIDAQLDTITFSAALYSPKGEYLKKAMPVINKYGTDAMPALFINTELVLYGGVPSTEKLTEVLLKAANPTKEMQV